MEHDILGPFHETVDVTTRLDSLANAKVSWPLLDQGVLLNSLLQLRNGLFLRDVRKSSHLGLSLALGFLGGQHRDILSLNFLYLLGLDDLLLAGRLQIRKK